MRIAYHVPRAAFLEPGDSGDNVLVTGLATRAPRARARPPPREHARREGARPRPGPGPARARGGGQRRAPDAPLRAGRLARVHAVRDLPRPLRLVAAPAPVRAVRGRRGTARAAPAPTPPALPARPPPLAPSRRRRHGLPPSQRRAGRLARRRPGPHRAPAACDRPARAPVPGGGQARARASRRRARRGLCQQAHRAEGRRTAGEDRGRRRAPPHACRSPVRRRLRRRR